MYLCTKIVISDEQNIKIASTYLSDGQINSTNARNMAIFHDNCTANMTGNGSTPTSPSMAVNINATVCLPVDHYISAFCSSNACTISFFNLLSEPHTSMTPEASINRISSSVVGTSSNCKPTGELKSVIYLVGTLVVALISGINIFVCCVLCFKGKQYKKLSSGELQWNEL